MLTIAPILTVSLLSLAISPSLLGAQSSERGIDRESLQFSPGCGNVAVDEAIRNESGFHAILGNLSVSSFVGENFSSKCQVFFKMNIPDGYQATALIIFTGSVRTANKEGSLAEANAEFSYAVPPLSSHFAPLMDNQHFLPGVEQDIRLSNFASVLANWTECAPEANRDVSATVSLHSYNDAFVGLEEIHVGLLYRQCASLETPENR